MGHKTWQMCLSILSCLVLTLGIVSTGFAQDSTPEAPIIENPIDIETPSTEVSATETVTPESTEESVEAPEATFVAAKSPMNPVPNAITSVSVSPTVLGDACDTVTVAIAFVVPDEAGVGSTFSINLDPRLQIPNQTGFLPSPDPSVNIARVNIVDNVATFTLLSYVETHDNNSGFAYIDSMGCWAEDFAGTDVDLIFTGDISGGDVEQTVTVPALPPTNTPVPTNTTGPTNTQTQTSTPTNTPTLTPTWDPSVPTHTPVPTNTATATATATNTPTLTPTWDPSVPTYTPTATNTPRPTNTPTATPEPIRNAQKRGEFLTYDQGKTDGDKAIKWTVDGLQGPFTSLTITDSIPAGANWEFDCDAGSVTFWPTAGTTFTCSPTEVTVTFTNIDANTWPTVSMIGDTKAPFEGLQTFENNSSWTGDQSSGSSSTGWLVQTQQGGGGGGGNTPTPLPTNTPTATATATPPEISITPVDPTETAGACVGGEWTAPTVTVATTEGVTYEVSAIDPETGTYTVTATLEEGYVWGTLPSGWTEQEDGSATFAGAVDLNPCVDVTPVAPAVIQAVCTGGGVVPPSVTPATTEGITYSIDGTIAPGKTVTVIATLEDGHGWGTLPAGWTDNEDGTASYEVVLEDVECAPVMPVTPTVSGNTCLGGVYTPPTVSVNDSESGIGYEIGTVNMETGAYTVVATLTDGQEWDVFPTGWTETNPTTATYNGVIELAPCTPVAPVDPKITEAVCTGGVLVAPSVTPAETDGIVYTIEGGVTPGSTVLVKATLEDGYSWAALPDGWTLVDDAKATFTINLASVKCEAPQPVATVVVNELPSTGQGESESSQTVTMLLALAAMMMIAGAGIVIRRSRTTRD